MNIFFRNWNFVEKIDAPLENDLPLTSFILIRSYSFQNHFEEEIARFRSVLERVRSDQYEGSYGRNKHGSKITQFGGGGDR